MKFNCPNCGFEFSSMREINDKKMLEFCKDNIKSVGEIARYLRIAPKNVSVRLRKLEDMKLIEVKKLGKGKKTMVKTINKVESPTFTKPEQSKLKGGIE